MMPADLNAVARLVMAAERCGSQLLDDAQSFDEVFGWGRFAGLDSAVLNEARRQVKAPRNGVGKTRVK